MSLVQLQEKCRHAVDVQELTMGSFRQEWGSACVNETEKRARQHRDGERWNWVTHILPPVPSPPPKAALFMSGCTFWPASLQGRLELASFSMHPWISYINTLSRSINKICIWWSLEIIVRPQEKKNYKCFQGFKSKLTIRVWQNRSSITTNREASIPHNSESLIQPRIKIAPSSFIIP